MPTPFMHLAFAERVRADAAVPTAMRDLINAQWGAFLLGNIAPDARVSSGIRRADTHFFEYEPVIATPALTTMLSHFPELARTAVESDSQVAFIAGYGAHLAMDEVWCVEMLFPHFMRRWDDEFTSFRMLHMLLGYLDKRDYESLPIAEQYPALSSAAPERWLPFIPDAALIEWRNVVAEQVAPGGASQTLTILSLRIKMDASEMQSFMAAADKMEQYLWRNVPPPVVESVEASMYARARATLIEYLNG